MTSTSCSFHRQFVNNTEKHVACPAIFSLAGEAAKSLINTGHIEICLWPSSSRPTARDIKPSNFYIVYTITSVGNMVHASPQLGAVQSSSDPLL